MKRSDALWKKFYDHVLRVMKSVGAQRVADQWSDDRWLLNTAYGSMQLTLHDPELTGTPTFAVFGRFLGSGPFPSGANSYSGKMNFHLGGDPKRITDADMKDFFRLLQGRLEAISALDNPASEKTETVILNWRPGGYQDEKLITATWSGGVMWGRPSWDSDAEREIRSRIMKVVPGAKFRWAGAKVDAETRADLAVDGRKSNPRRVAVNVGKSGLPKGYRTEIARDGKRWSWSVFLGGEHVAGGYGRSRSDAEHDADVWMREQVRKNPAGGSDAILMARGQMLALTDDSDEENRLRSNGWDEAGDTTVRKLARLRQLDKNGWAELTDRPFTESDLDDALSRQNPAVTGDRGQYRLHYMEPGTRRGSFRKAIRKVDSVEEAVRWMRDNRSVAHLPASVMTPGNRWQSPETVAILGEDHFTSTQASYDRLPV